MPVIIRFKFGDGGWVNLWSPREEKVNMQFKCFNCTNEVTDENLCSDCTRCPDCCNCLNDCCLLCTNWVVHKPKPGEKLFWRCKEEIVESVAYDDRKGIIQMSSPFRCVHYTRLTE